MIALDDRDSRLDLSMSYGGLSSRPGAVAMCDCQNDSVGSESRIHNDEWEMVECVFPQSAR